MNKILWGGVLTLCLTACATMNGNKKGGRTPAVQDIYSATWQLQSVVSSDSEELLVPNTDTITLRFTADGQLGGYGGCNTFGGSFETDGEKIKVGRVMSTRRGCPILMFENAMLRSLREVDGYVIDRNRLLLKKGDDVLLTYEAQ